MSCGSNGQCLTICRECGQRLETRVAFESFPMVLEVRLKWGQGKGGPTAATLKMVIPRLLDLRLARYELLGPIWHSKPLAHECGGFSNRIMIYDDLYSNGGSLDNSKGLLGLLAPTPPYEWSSFFNFATSEAPHRLYFIKMHENSSQDKMHCNSRRLWNNAVGKSPE